MSNGTITMTGAEYDALAGKIAALEAELARLCAGQEPVRFWFIGDAGQQKGATYCKKSSRDGSLAFFECEKDAKRAALRHPGTEVYPVEYYRKPQATPQPSAMPDGWRELLQEVAEYAPPYGTIVAMTSQMALGSKARRMLAAAPSAPATVPSVNQQLLEALDDLVSWVYRNNQFGCTPMAIVRAAYAIAAARKGEV